MSAGERTLTVVSMPSRRAEDRERPEEREAEHADAPGRDEAAGGERQQHAAGGEQEVRDRHLVAALPQLDEHGRPDEREDDVDEEAQLVPVEHRAGEGVPDHERRQAEAAAPAARLRVRLRAADRRSPTTGRA